MGFSKHVNIVSVTANPQGINTWLIHVKENIKNEAVMGLPVLLAEAERKTPL